MGWLAALFYNFGLPARCLGFGKLALGLSERGVG